MLPIILHNICTYTFHNLHYKTMNDTIKLPTMAGNPTAERLFFPVVLS